MEITAQVLFHWLDNTAQLSQRVCVVLMVAYVSIRMEWLRVVLLDDHGQWRKRLISALFFGIFAIIGTHSGFLLDVHHIGKKVAWPGDLSDALQRTQAVIGFRDLMVLAAGLTGGPWVGLGAGLLAGGERYLLGGFAAPASAIATIIQGLWAGSFYQWRPRWARSLRGAGFVALMGTMLQKLTLLALVQPNAYAIALVMETLLPVLIVNTAGVLLFMFVMQDLERDRLKNQAQQAELRALNAQIEPHFINNAMNAIKALIIKDPDAARHFVVEMANFLEDTRRVAGINAIPLAQEISQLERYLSFQSLRFEDKFSYHIAIANSLLSYQVPPRSLQTLVENALQHAMRGGAALTIFISAQDLGDKLQLQVKDNGKGIAPERLAELGKHPVVSSNGNGSALFHLRSSLRLAFPNLTRMNIASTLGQGTDIIIVLPKRTTPW